MGLPPLRFAAFRQPHILSLGFKSSMSTKASRNVIAFIALAVFFGIACVSMAIYVATTPLSKQLYELDYEQKQLIGIASKYVNEYQESYARTPTDIEFSQWVSTHKNDYPGFDGWAYSLQTSKYPSDLIKNFGAPPKNGYVLEFWNGDLMVSYASWSSRKETAYITESEYFPFGSRPISILVFLGMPLFMFALCLKRRVNGA